MPPTAWIVRNLWLIPALPMAAAGCIAVLTQKRRTIAAALAIGSMFLAFLLAVCAFAHVLTLRSQGAADLQVFNFHWLQFGTQWLSLGWMLDPLTALMLLMVTFVGLLIFIFSVGYMSHDENFTRFFCFLALFAGAMLGVLIANNLLLLFMCWEVVGLTSYLLIGFWFTNPRAAAAAKKAFIVTRIGDLGFLLGMVWLYAQSGTLLFYDGGTGTLEHAAIAAILTHTTVFGMSVATAIALLIFCGAAGKSGQVPLHVWLPDAMEGPTPVSALIHAATMVAAGVFLVARMYPLMSAQVSALAITPSTALEVVTWIGAITALFGAFIAVAQFDIKRILAYSTISQLGYMMMGLGAGGVAVGMFHLLTHAFFKALLFLGAGSVIHGCSGEQDIRFMGGLRKRMPVTFATYTAGMLALCGFPLLFSGFWSKDEILFSAHAWSVSHIPFYFGAFAALLTAFYMTRQMFYVFAGAHRAAPRSHEAHVEDASSPSLHHPPAGPHESPPVMLAPLVLLATFAVLLGFLGTPAWPWLQSFLENEPAAFSFAGFSTPGLMAVMLSSSAIVIAGLTLGWWIYGRKAIQDSAAHDPLAKAQPAVFSMLANAFYVDAIYHATFVRAANVLAALSAWFDRWIWNGVVQTVSALVIGFGYFDSFFDTHVVNTSFDEGCRGVSGSARLLARLQNGKVQHYLRGIAVACIIFVVLLLWRAAR
jgi:NADH-quinone oxidoreductase subunit L